MARTSTERPVPESQATDPVDAPGTEASTTSPEASAPVGGQGPAAAANDPTATTGTAATNSEPAPEPEEEPVGPAAEVKRFVKYTGTADERILTAKDFVDQGGDGTDKKVVWNRANRFVIESSEFTPAALAYLLDRDGGFKSVDHP